MSTAAPRSWWRTVAWVIALASIFPTVAEAASWTTTAPMATGRGYHTATLLQDGRVLVAGGSGGIASAELYDPAAASWTVTGSMAVARDFHTATLLQDGRVLVVGGSSAAAQSAAEIYDPAQGTWSATGSLAAGRFRHSATLLPDGRVLVAGGQVGSALASAELYDPATGTWDDTAPLATARAWHPAVLLADGRVLVAGGHTGAGGSYLTSAEIYDPVAAAWTNAASMAVTHSEIQPTVLADGRVLLAGGFTGNHIVRTEIYDPVANTWTTTGPLAVGRHLYTTALLPDGRVLVAGGHLGSAGLAASELYNPVTGTWTNAGHMAAARFGHAGVLLPDGRALVTGGIGVDFGPGLQSVEIYRPEPALRVSNTAAAEGDTGPVDVVFTATLLPAATSAVTVDWATAAAGGATSDVDYVAASGTLTFAAGQTLRTFEVAVLGDVADEGPESFYVNLSNASGAPIGDGQGECVIADDDPEPVIGFGTEPVNTEADVTTRPATFTVTLTGLTERTVDVTFASGTLGTATSGTDYAPKMGTIRFTPGQTSKTLKILITGDVVDEPRETFFVELANPLNATLSDTEARGIIVDNDPTPAGSPDISIADTTTIEGDGGVVNASFTVSLSAPAVTDVTFSYATGAGGSAATGVDYVGFTYRSATIAAGQTSRTIPVTVNGDDVDEPDETFYVNVTSASNATIVDGQGKGTIVDDEP